MKPKASWGFRPYTWLPEGLSLRQEVEGGKQWIAEETRDSTCHLWASRGRFIYYYKGGGV
jgi:hypothetical protein